MNFLDDHKNYKQYDTENLYDSLSKISRQIETGWHAADFINLGFDPESIHNIVVAGMGGSNLAAEVARSLSPFLLNLPFEIVANYRLPLYAGKNTLVILSSYSGNTEETLSCAQDSAMRGCPSICITTGGKLKEFSHSHDIPLIELEEKHNPSKSPRAGIGLNLGALLGLLLRLNPSAKRHFNSKDIIQTVERVVDMVNINKDTQDNPAKLLASKHKGLGILFLSANHLVGVGKVFENYLNESAKTFCAAYNFPDLNHHFLDGLIFPTSLKDETSFVILNSSLFPEIIQKRVQISREVLLKQKYRVSIIKPETTDPILQVFESLVFLVMFSYYLSISNKVNPASNPWVDYLKENLH